MTRDEILKLEAGRELDALVAEQVMGFVDLGPLQLADLRYQKPTTDGVVVLGRLPNYSTDIAAAWQVVEKISKLYHVEIENFDGGYGVTLDDYSQTWEAHAPTAPLAISRAALLAVMVTDDQQV